ncbi:hypothetical protein [Fibrella forsythiae]|uniref:GIY-YIG domain-containing protein n=1 Tax=Fibrella forsythiae TaxID=2817061 RepID=A0ABS3JCZ0_9BACT|nr:hypothetical protein [Fibrella forsythiae]MBO0947311.1 hypothetical protein [Fibrella forsythiae]
MQSQTPTGYIYALVCPETDLIRYVGKTKNDPLYRFIQHQQEALRKRGRPKPGTVHHWIEELAHRSQQPRIMLLCECTLTDLDEQEMLYYLKYKHLGLLNGMPPCRLKSEVDAIDVVKLNKIMEEKGLTKSAVAKLVNVRHTGVCLVLKGDLYGLSMEDLKRMNKYLLSL